MNDDLEILSRPQAIENYRQYLLLTKQIFYRKPSLGVPH